LTANPTLVMRRGWRSLMIPQGAMCDVGAFERQASD